MSIADTDKISRAMYRAVDLIELNFPHPKIPNKLITLGPYQKDFIDTIQYGFPITKFKFSEVEDPPDGVIFITRRQVGKCLTIDTRIQLSDGSLKKAKDLTALDSLITKDNDFVKQDGIKIFDNGKKDCVKITTQYGREIKTTENHPFLTHTTPKSEEQYIEANDLSIGDRIGMVRNLPEMGKEILSDHEIKFLAYMIAEGSLVTYFSENGSVKTQNCTFTNTEEDIRKEFESITNPTKVNNRTYYISNDKNKELRDLLKDTGLFGTKSDTKFIPEIIFKSSTRQIKLFLSKLIDTDGWVIKKPNNSVRIGYGSKSQKLIRQLSYLFTRIGMYGKVRKKHSKKYDSDHWEINFGSSIDIKNAKKNLTLCERKQTILDSANPKGHDHIDTFPVWNKVLEAIQFDLKRKTDLRNKGIGLKYKYSISPAKIQKLENELYNLDINKNIFWDRIEKIEQIGKHRTIGIEVPNTHNHITNGFITHNSTCCAYSAAALMILGPESRGSPPCNIGIIAASEEESHLLIDKVKKALRNSKYKDKIKEEKVNKVVLTNGSVCTAHTHSGKSIRGPSYDYLFLDEARKIDEEVMFSAALPTVEHGDRWVAITTPKGDASRLIEYYDRALKSRPIICSKCGREYSQTEFKQTFPTRGNIREMPDSLPACHNCGHEIYKYGIGIYATPYLDPWKTPIIDQDKLRKTLDRHNWSPWARQEYLGEIISEASMVIHNEWIENCINMRRRNNKHRKQNIRYVLGVDYGRQHDATAFAVCHKKRKDGKDLIYLDYLKTVSGEFDQETDYAGIRMDLKRIIEYWQPSLVVPDATGQGLPQVERLQKDLRFWKGQSKLYTEKKGKKLGFVIDRRNKPDLIGELINALSTGKLVLPPRTEPEISELIEELLRFECEIQDSGYIKYGTQNHHDDRLIAVALALWGFRTNTRAKTYIRGFDYAEPSRARTKNKIKTFNLL